MLRHKSVILFQAALFCSIHVIAIGNENPSLLYANFQPPKIHAIQLMISINESDLNKSVNFAKQLVDGMERLETNLDWSNIHILSGSPSHGQLINSKPEPEALKQGKSALIAAKATAQLMHVHCSKYHLTLPDCIKQISQLSLPSTSLFSSCSENNFLCTPQQLNSPYYSADGSCNNKYNGSLGKSFSGYKRLLPANYIDAVQEPQTRSANSKRILATPRLISTTLSKHRLIENNELTLAVRQWSQFIEHDLAHTAMNKMVHSTKTIECCDLDGSNLSPRYIHPFCLPISIPENDVFYSEHGIECMPYIRSVIAMKSDCKFGTVDQMNQATHFLDGSQIYGSDFNKLYSLRKLKRGLLNFRQLEGLEFLPKLANPMEDCQYTNESCFISGDSRVNSHPQLTAMHILWLREHNRIASGLSRINGHWSDETIYQEARRIVIAEMQHITYNEWLPLVLGTQDVKIQRPDAYSAEVDSRVSNSFATAGLRFINSLIEDKLNMYKENRKVYSTLNIKDYFNKPHIVEESINLDGLIRGLSTQHSQRLDLDYAEAVTTYLYNNGDYGFDILSLDIQRGRDHGLPTYSSVRKLCGLSSVQEFSSLSEIMLPETLTLLERLYHSPEDIDLLVGGMSEKPDGDSLLGPTLSCIVADQLLRTRRGDRYFYDNSEQPKPFTKAQLFEIEKTSLARIFCDNGDSIEFMQPNAFKHIGKSNYLSSCIGKEISYLNLIEWKVFPAEK